MVCLIRVMRGLIGVVLLSIVGCTPNQAAELLAQPVQCLIAAVYAHDSPYCAISVEGSDQKGS